MIFVCSRVYNNALSAVTNSQLFSVVNLMLKSDKIFIILSEIIP